MPHTIFEALLALLPRAWRKQYHYRQLYRLMSAARSDIEDFRRWGLLLMPRDEAPPADDKERQ